MSRRIILLSAVLSGLVLLAAIAGAMDFAGYAVAAPAAQVTRPAGVDTLAYVSVSALVFEPINPDIRFNKNTARQLLSLTGQAHDVSGTNIFMAPIYLPDRGLLMGITVFGEDFDNQGAVQVRLKRCDHGQARCLSLAEPTSTNPFALGQFETLKVTNLNEVVNNNLYSYILELDLTALGGSGLRSVRLELLDRSSSGGGGGGQAEIWSLSGSLTSFLLPNTGYTQVQICTDDLSHLPNTTHYPVLVVDGESTRLSGNKCLTTWGRTIEIRRSFNTGPSSGTYQYLR